ncbi:MAG: rhamnogalacturonan acetylesterase [Mangrovibacterium sp.]
MKSRYWSFVGVFFFLCFAEVAIGQFAKGFKTLKYDFGNGKTEKGFTAVTSSNQYSDATGFGLTCPNGVITSSQKGKKPALSSDCVTSAEAFFFVVDVPEGRYKVTLELGNPNASARTTVKAESRRLMLEDIATRPGQIETRTLIIDVRRPKISEGRSVLLKEREKGSKTWDNNLCLEFNGVNPSVCSVEIESANELPVIFLAGNSTVTDQRMEPWASWGQTLPRFLKPNIAVANFAESGETLIGFRKERRLEKLLSVMKPGDFLFMEFAHNDQKEGSCHVDPYTTYQDELRFYIAEAKKKGGIPVLVTSTNRRKFDENGNLVNTLDEYPNAMRQLARDEQVLLIDLIAMSKSLYEALGVEGSIKAFVHYPINTFPGVNRELKDDTHFNAYGAYELAKCVVSKMITMHEFKDFVVDDFGSFNPASPDSADKFFWPLSPLFDAEKPEGN